MSDKQPATVYAVVCFGPRSVCDPFTSWTEEYFDRAEAEAARARHMARGGGFYAQPIQERPYAPVERKSNFFGPPVRWDLPPIYCGSMLTLAEALERRYGAKDDDDGD